MATERSVYARVGLALIMAITLTGAQPRVANFDKRVLSSHNYERAMLGVRPLVWDATLAKNAQGWADELVRTRAFKHSPSSRAAAREGENIWGGTPQAFTPEGMVGLWIKEKGSFVPGIFPRNSATGRVEDVSHYTQMIWRQTNAVGCALSSGDHEEILVCRYSEAGNVRGYRPF